MKKVSDIKEKIEELFEELHYLQDACPHTNAIGEYGANTGGYDPTADLYWLDIHCQDCDKIMTFYSNEPEYRTFKFTKK